jgi:hypothetical protein
MRLVSAVQPVVSSLQASRVPLHEEYAASRVSNPAVEHVEIATWPSAEAL